jgi:hypothetical protein
MRRILIALAVAACIPIAVTVSASAKQKPSSPHRTSLQRELQAAKAATARFHSLRQALKAGYVLPPAPLKDHCVSSPAGGMGVHLENPALMADAALDIRRPEILNYAIKPNGRLRLVALEYFVASSLAPTAPVLFGHTFDGPMPGHHPGMPEHYDLHAWVWKANPSGMFAMFNPNLHCPS